MPLDAICLSAVTDELRGQLIGARVDKVVQPERDELGIAVRSQTIGNVKLLISANQNHARIHLTAQSRENPSTPPMFCMLLRKHLNGARVVEITQPAFERAVLLVFDATNEMGERVKRTLVAELQGRHSNIILLDENERIVDCLKRVDYEMSEQRPVLPGLFYHLPPKPDKIAPDDIAAWRELDAANLTDKAIIARFSGISPLIAREISHNRDISGFVERVKSKQFTPVLLSDGGKPVDFAYMPITQYGGLYQLDTLSGFSQLLDNFFTARDSREHLQKRASGLRKTVKTALERTRRKLALQAVEYEATLNRERLRECGDLLMANLHNMTRGDAAITVADFYHDDAPATIKLDVLLTPHRNASKYYHNYQKAKNAQEMLKINIERGNIDLEYLESVLNALDNIAGEADIRDIQDELIAAGFLPKRKDVKKAQKTSKPLVFTTESGINIYVGRNNRQNDELTLKTAAKSDIWLHVQKIAGSHVIIDCKNGEPSDADLLKAATLAAQYSQARNGLKVPVDYTRVKYVKKMAGGKPGMVIYDRFKTIIVDP
ncbi:hypothetical protein FACS1894217_00870 [Clostridia bacterium]|nr:hypothetical protein FACS1894217_00870 [Clostridia bacterium]